MTIADFRRIAGNCKNYLPTFTSTEASTLAALMLACVAVVIVALDDMRWQNRVIDLTARVDTLMKVSNDAGFWRDEARGAFDAIRRECKR